MSVPPPSPQPVSSESPPPPPLPPPFNRATTTSAAATAAATPAPFYIHTFEDGARVKVVRPCPAVTPKRIGDAELREKLRTGQYMLFDRATGAIVRQNPFDPAAPPLPTVREALVNARAVMEAARNQNDAAGSSCKKPK
jgi:hypothetical protein